VKPRVRRTPEASREHLLNAAEAVFARISPDVAGLKDIAAEADVSLGLVTHYFGTYAALVETTIERRLDRLLATALAPLAAGNVGVSNGPAPIDALLAFMEDRVALRLVIWGLTQDSPPEILQRARDRRLAIVVDGFAAHLGALGLNIPRERLNFSIGAAVAMALGLGIAAPFLEASLDAPGSLTPGGRLREDWQRMLTAHLLSP